MRESIFATRIVAARDMLMRPGSFALIALAALLAACSSRPIDVVVRPAERGVVETLVANSEAGTVQARHHVRLAAERTGRVLALPWNEGDEVPAGAIVVQLDASSEQVRLHAARHDVQAADAAHRAAHADAELAEREYKRAAALHAQGLSSDEALETARAKRDAAAAALAQYEARLDASGAAVSGHQDELAHLRVIMPFHGVLTKRLVEPGESVVPGQVVAEVMTLDSLDVHAPLDERDAADVRVGQPVRVTLDPFPGVTWDARVTRVAPVVEETREQNRTLTIEAQLDPVAGDSRPRPGMSADLEVILAHRDDVLRVPSTAVIDGSRVLVLKNGRAVARDVRTGARNWDWTEVVSGLQPGEPVIVSLDRTGVVAGARVRAERKAGAAGTANASSRPAGGTRDTASATARGAARPGGLPERPR